MLPEFVENDAPPTEHLVMLGKIYITVNLFFQLVNIFLGKSGPCTFKNNRYMYVTIHAFMVFIVVYKNTCLSCVANRYPLNWWRPATLLHRKSGICKLTESHIN